MTPDYVEARIREGRVLVASPDAVAAEFRDYGLTLANKVFAVADEELERRLLQRDERAINLALARYAGTPEVVRALYLKAAEISRDPLEVSYLKALRISCLANQSLRRLFDGFPERVIGKEELHRLIQTAGTDELGALFTNPTIEGEVLEQLYTNAPPFNALDSERRRQLVRLSSDNPRLTTKEESEHGPDLGYWSIHESIVRLLATAPVEVVWLRTLHGLLERLDPGDIPGPKENVTMILDRWRALVPPDKPLEGYVTELPLQEEFCCLIAAMYGQYFEKDEGYKAKLIGTADSADVALRCAYYGKGQLTEAAMAKGRDRDGAVYAMAALCNDSLFLKPALRRELESQAAGLGHIYRRRCQQIHRRRRWFDPAPSDRDLFEEEPTEDQTPRRLSAIETALSALASEQRRFRVQMFWGALIVVTLIAIALR